MNVIDFTLIIGGLTVLSGYMLTLSVRFITIVYKENLRRINQLEKIAKVCSLLDKYCKEHEFKDEKDLIDTKAEINEVLVEIYLWFPDEIYDIFHIVIEENVKSKGVFYTSETKELLQKIRIMINNSFKEAIIIDFLNIKSLKKIFTNRLNGNTNLQNKIEEHKEVKERVLFYL